MLFWCLPGSGGLNFEGGVTNVDLTGGDDAPGWVDDSFDGNSGPWPQPLGQNTNGTPFKIYPWAVWPMREGWRVRLTVAWDSCPQSDIGTGPASLSADLDVWLCDYAAQKCVAASRSYDDNNEGFDVIVPATADYTVLVGYDPDNSPGCGMEYEPVAWAAVYGDPDIF